ncbi:MAG: rhomboid family intramembrane serine protease [Sedimentisphaerales bacterium]|nr:rhomboid family intramembrane serine protease [Sedimentisphaerales bacterium]
MAEDEIRIEWALPSPKKLFTPAVTIILVLLVAGWTLLHYALGFTFNYLALSLQGILRGRIWQLVTYPFFNTCTVTLILDGLLILFIGSAVEREWRTGSFILLWLVVCIVCGIIWISISALLGKNYIGLGSDSCAYGLIAVFGLLHRKRRVLALFWAVEAQYITWGLIVIGIVLGIPQPITWIWVSGALVAYLYVKLRWRISASVKNNLPNRYKPGSFVDID